jgi:Leucine-rich repeat (LRR) protein
MWYVIRSDDEIDIDWCYIEGFIEDYIDQGAWGPVVYDIEWDGQDRYDDSWGGIPPSTYLPNTILVEHSNGTNTNEQKLCIPEGDYTLHARVSGGISRPGWSQQPFHGNTALVDTYDGVEEGFGVSNSWFILSSGDDNLACGDLLSGWENIAEENRYTDGYTLQFTLPPGSGINASSSYSCLGMDDAGRNDIALKTLQCYYSAFDYDFDPGLRNELINLDEMIKSRLINTDAWFSNECGQLLSEACNSSKSLGFTDDQFDEFCAYHQCAIDKRTPYWDNSSHECDCLYNQWDCKHGRLGCTEDLRENSLECCGNTGNSCLCMLEPLCMDGETEKCGDYATNCCADGDDSCKCDYSTKSCIGQLQDGGDVHYGSCNEADVSCAQCGGFYTLGGGCGAIISHCERGCDYWTRMCLEYPGASCHIAAGRCCGSPVCYTPHNPSCYCEFFRYAKDELDYELEYKDACQRTSQLISNPDMERQQLITLYDNLNGDNWFNNSKWKSEEEHHCNWYGISCNEEQIVSALDLGSNNLVGDFFNVGDYGNGNEIISTLSQITSLQLSDNKLYGRVYYIDLYASRSLQYIDLSGNDFSGELHVLLSPSLQYLNVSRNSFTYLGGYPKYKGSYQTIHIIDISYNDIEAVASDVLTDLPPNLREFVLTGNSISGKLPNPLPLLEEMRRFIINENQLTGQLPDISRSLPIIRELDLSNQTGRGGLVGSIPTRWSNMRDLERLDISYNNFNGKLPPSIGNLPQLRVLNVSNNVLSGSFIPYEIGKLADSLQSFDASNNKGTGLLPSILGDFSEASMQLSGNNIMPPAPLSLCDVRLFDLKDNITLCPPQESRCWYCVI